VAQQSSGVGHVQVSTSSHERDAAEGADSPINSPGPLSPLSVSGSDGEEGDKENTPPDAAFRGVAPVLVRSNPCNRGSGSSGCYPHSSDEESVVAALRMTRARTSRSPSPLLSGDSRASPETGSPEFSQASANPLPVSAGRPQEFSERPQPSAEYARASPFLLPASPVYAPDLPGYESESPIYVPASPMYIPSREWTGATREDKADTPRASVETAPETPMVTPKRAVRRPLAEISPRRLEVPPKPRFSCPFRKRNSLRFNVSDHKECALQSFDNISCVKYVCPAVPCQLYEHVQLTVSQTTYQEVPQDRTPRRKCLRSLQDGFWKLGGLQRASTVSRCLQMLQPTPRPRRRHGLQDLAGSAQKGTPV
jgi:hypothetical protein